MWACNKPRLACTEGIHYSFSGATALRAWWAYASFHHCLWFQFRANIDHSTQFIRLRLGLLFSFVAWVIFPSGLSYCIWTICPAHLTLIDFKKRVTPASLYVSYSSDYNASPTDRSFQKHVCLVLVLFSRCPLTYVFKSL